MPNASEMSAYYVGDRVVTRVLAGEIEVWPLIPDLPVLNSITPTSMFHLDSAKTLTATGTNFDQPGCVLQIKGTGGWVNVASSTVVNATTMTGSVDMTPGNYKISVLDGLSRRTAEKDFQGQHNTPVLNSISPTQMYIEDAGQRLTVSGSNFYAGGSGYTGLSIYVLQPGGGWVARTAAVTNAGSAYTDGFDPGVVGTWKIMCGYDNPNAPRSAQKDLSVINRPPPASTVTSVSGNVDRYMGGTITINGTNLRGTVTLKLTTCGTFGPYNCTVNSATQATVNGSQFWHSSTNFPDSYHNCTVVVDGQTFNLNSQPVKFT